MERKLHIGGREARAGWEILNINPGPDVDHIGDAIKLTDFADGTFAEVYASHVLEHFDCKEGVMGALKEWHRVLAPGGVLRLSVPDLDVLAQLLLQRERLDVNQRFHVMRMIFGGHVDAHDHHIVGLNEEFLAGYLYGTGFTDVRRVQRHGIFRDTSDMVFAGTPISLNLYAVKAGAAVAAVAAAARQGSEVVA